jgi:hypothetical protein
MPREPTLDQRLRTYRAWETEWAQIPDDISNADFDDLGDQTDLAYDDVLEYKPRTLAELHRKAAFLRRLCVARLYNDDEKVTTLADDIERLTRS